MSSSEFRGEVTRPQFDKPQNLTTMKREVAAIGLIVVTLFFLLDTLSWFTNQGGVFSLLSALASVHTKPAVVDIDENALRLPIIIGIWLVLFVIFRLLDFEIDTSKRRNDLLLIFVFIGGGFVGDAMLGKSVITHYMTGQGYNRCEAGDWAHGNRQSRVWFADFVRDGVECRQRIQSVPSRSILDLSAR